MEIKIKKLHQDAIVPQYATFGAACFDISTTGNYGLHPTDRNARIFDTGLAFEIPEGYVMMVYSRSGHGFKNGIRLSNAVGVIDSDYRGELKVCLRADGAIDGPFQKGERVAQAMIIPVQQVKFTEVEDLSETDRGQGGFGSTGA